MTATLLDPSTVGAYLASRDDLAHLIDPSTVTVREVGDGNLNLVFIATDAQNRSLVIKQSLPYVRMVGESWPLSQDRILAEARGYDAATRFSPESIPEYHGLDEPRRLIVLEDLSGWTVWRTALNEGRLSPGAAAVVGRHVARVGFGTSVFALDSAAHKAAVAAAVNPELCRITEDLVFTEPYRDAENNAWDEQLTDAVLALRNDAMLAEVAELKLAFTTRAEALVHGDLHTGSIFVPRGGAPDAAKVFDAEFSFYGPIGFDLGALFGNVLLARARATVLERPDEFVDWLDGLVAEAWQAFEAEYRALWTTRADDSYTDRFLDAWLRRTWSDAVGFGGLKAIRRIVGLAKVSDIQTLDTEDRVRAAALVLEAAQAWVRERSALGTPDDLLERTLGILGRR